MKTFDILSALSAVAIVAALPACGGGGGGAAAVPTAPNGSGGPPSPQSSSVTGSVVDFSSGTALAGFTVTLGTLPNPATCNGAQTASLNVCGTPASTVATATTSSNGSFAFTAPTGSYMLVIGNGTETYATLHRALAVSSGANAVGTVRLTALTSDQQAWLADVNNQRATVSFPTSFPNLFVDEYAQEQANAWAPSAAAGTTAYTDAAYAPYQSAYSASPGAMYDAAGTLAQIVSYYNVTPGYAQSDQGWMAEKANCPSGNWQTCTFSETTGHYVNISNTDTVWIGLGESVTSAAAVSGAAPYYDLMLIENLGSVGPASHARVADATFK